MRISIPASLAPILERLQLDGSKWVDTVESFHSRCGLVVGFGEAVSAAVRRVGRKWFRGAKFCATAAAR
jgi:hypothetical protein